MVVGVSTDSLFCGFASACDLPAITLTLVGDVRATCGSAEISVSL